MSPEKETEYIYIVQSSKEPSWCKIGKSNDYERRLKEYNSMTGKSKDNIYSYLFVCEVKDMRQVENDITAKFKILRQDSKKEIYLCSKESLAEYIKFIKEHPLFIEEIFLEKKDEVIIKEKIVKKETPSLKRRELTSNDIMQKAKRVKNDEFYTRYEDIEKEIKMYDKSIWKDKCVFCNCDDAVNEDDDTKTSAFALYFIRNFKELGLKKLICTHYASKEDLFNAGSKGYAYFYIMTKEGGKGEYEYPKGYDGSFDHEISIKILKEEADIVCTNPPFSRSRDYWNLIIGSNKKFLILGNFANPITKAYIHYFVDNKVWAGYNRVDWYENPKRQLVNAPGHWYTNFSIKDRPRYKNIKIMPLKKIPEKYKKYDDSKILLVDNCYIPSDYKKPFAVSGYVILNGLLEKGYKIFQIKEYYPYIKNKKKFGRVLVQKG
jgi:predicted GIY-YIG superfamily endonuclease